MADLGERIDLLALVMARGYRSAERVGALQTQP
jgi:hypothetical protein